MLAGCECSERQRTGPGDDSPDVVGIISVSLSPSQASVVKGFRDIKPRQLKCSSKTRRCMFRIEISAHRPCSGPGSSHSIDLSDCDQRMTSSPATHPLTGRLKLRIPAKRCPRARQSHARIHERLCPLFLIEEFVKLHVLSGNVVHAWAARV